MFCEEQYVDRRGRHLIFLQVWTQLSRLMVPVWEGELLQRHICYITNLSAGVSCMLGIGQLPSQEALSPWRVACLVNRSKQLEISSIGTDPLTVAECSAVAAMGCSTRQVCCSALAPECFPFARPVHFLRHVHA